MLEQIKARITQIETEMQTLVSQHTILTGHLNEAKHFLDMLSKVSSELAPDNSVTDAIQIVDKIVDEVIPE